MIVAIAAVIHGAILIVFLSNLYYLYLRRAGSTAEKDPLPPISVLIPARNEAANLQRLLPALLQQDYTRYEVIVYNDASTDGTADVLAAESNGRVNIIDGRQLPGGWVGKSNALFQSTRVATGELYLFLDADTEPTDDKALRRLVNKFLRLPRGSVLTGLPRLRGGGLLLVSLIPFAILAWLPWLLVQHLRASSLASLNGQFWIIDSATYHNLEPHEYCKDRILEDVEIGRYLKRNGVTNFLEDVQSELNVYMYADLGEAWQGFRKNAYLLSGGHIVAFMLFFGVYTISFLMAPALHAGLLASLFVLKGLADLKSRFPAWITLLTPLAFLLGAVMMLDSAYNHLSGSVTWKGREISTR